MEKRLKKKYWVGGIVLGMVVAAGVGSGLRFWMGSTAEETATDTPAPATDVIEPLLSTPNQDFPGSLVAAANATTAAAPALLESTPAEARLAQITTGRRDPFAAIAISPATAAPKAEQPTTAPATAVAASGTAPTVFPIPVATAPAPLGLPALPSLPAMPVAAVAPQAIAVLPPASPGAIAPAATIEVPALPRPANPSIDTVEISGVVQIGNRYNIIVREHPDQESRYVAPGDYLASGRILVKRVDSNPGGDPIVILEQDGREYTRSVGGSELTGWL